MMLNPLMIMKLVGAVAGLAAIAWIGIQVKSTIDKAAQADQLALDLENQRAGTKALADRYVLETKRRWELQQREQELLDDRAVATREARTEYERISQEIMDALSTDACFAVPVPVAAVDGLRRAAAYANGTGPDPVRPIHSDTLRLD